MSYAFGVRNGTTWTAMRANVAQLNAALAEAERQLMRFKERAMAWAPKKHVPPGQQTEQQRKAEFQRTRADKDVQRFYQSAAWRRLRAIVLRDAPLCAMCQKAGIVKAARVVDHIIDVKDDPSRKLDRSNLQPLCSSCHNSKTAKRINAKGTT